jgi:hypothetical protein
MPTRGLGRSWLWLGACWPLPYQIISAGRRASLMADRRPSWLSVSGRYDPRLTSASGRLGLSTTSHLLGRPSSSVGPHRPLATGLAVVSATVEHRRLLGPGGRPAVGA